MVDFERNLPGATPVTSLKADEVPNSLETPSETVIASIIDTSDVPLDAILRTEE